MATNTDKKVIFDPSEDGTRLAQRAVGDPDVLAGLVEELSTGDRRVRQFSALVLYRISQTDPELLVPYVDELTEGIYVRENQTRWQMIDTLGILERLHPEIINKAQEGIETALFDENSGNVRLAAFRFLNNWGMTSHEASVSAWKLMEEAVQCYHGDPEFGDMLNLVKEFCQADIDEQVVKAIESRMTFDAENGRGYIKVECKEIVSLIQARQ